MYSSRLQVLKLPESIKYSSSSNQYCWSVWFIYIFPLRSLSDCTLSMKPRKQQVSNKGLDPSSCFYFHSVKLKVNFKWRWGKTSYHFTAFADNRTNLKVTGEMGNVTEYGLFGAIKVLNNTLKNRVNALVAPSRWYFLNFMTYGKLAKYITLDTQRQSLVVGAFLI